MGDSRRAGGMGVLVGLVILGLVGGLIVFSVGGNKKETVSPPEISVSRTGTGDESREVSPSELASERNLTDSGATAPREERLDGAPTVDSSKVKGEREYAVDPDDQPRTFYVADFVENPSVLEGGEFHNAQLTERGIELASDGLDESGIREGWVISPPVEADFAYNAMVPLWKVEQPEGTGIMVEMSVSPDGETWSDWEIAQMDQEFSEINPTYPDGSPNPNYGYFSGGLMFGRLLLFDQFRFRLTLISENDNTPIIPGMRVYYTDSTLGEGDYASADETANIWPERDAAEDQPQ